MAYVFVANYATEADMDAARDDYDWNVHNESWPHLISISMPVFPILPAVNGSDIPVAWLERMQHKVLDDLWELDGYVDPPDPDHPQPSFDEWCERFRWQTEGWHSVPPGRGYLSYQSWVLQEQTPPDCDDPDDPTGPVWTTVAVLTIQQRSIDE